MNRRRFIGVAGSSLAVVAGMRSPALFAGPFSPADFEKMIPADKKLQPDWLASLCARGARTIYRGKELELIGMPVGGICAGQLYLGGDGRIWHWDIFNEPVHTDDGHYAHQPAPSSPLAHGFAIRVGGTTRTIDRAGFADVSFCGEYPVARVEYRDKAVPVTVSLEAFSPFVPLDADTSSLPATVMRFTVRNVSGEPVKATLAGWLENAACLHHRQCMGTRRITFVNGTGHTFLNGSVEPLRAAGTAARPDIVFEDWRRDSYAGWTVEGTAFGSGPILRSAVPSYQGDVGGTGDRVVNSHAAAPGADTAARDAHVGTLTSAPFDIARNFINLWVGGGAHKDKTCVNVVVDGSVVRSVTGANDNRMTVQSLDVRDIAGRRTVISIVDNEPGAWGNIGVGSITFSDTPVDGALEEQSDYGTMGLALIGSSPHDHQAALIAMDRLPDAAFAVGPAESSRPMAEHMAGAIGRTLSLDPGTEATVAFVLAWHFPNDRIDGVTGAGVRRYSTRFGSAADVAAYVAAHLAQLAAQTMLWHDTWYDSTLPYWFLDRTFLNISILASSTAHWFAGGRFWAWEGVGCCHGTCTHVWHYAHAVARLFPALERDTRERVDLGLSLDHGSGVSGFRGEFDRGLAVDGQAGTILRIYREHLVSPDAEFVKRNWPHIQLMFKPLFALDPHDDGMLEGAQMNTLDQAWFGSISWLSSLYVAALRAGEAMAREMGAPEFATQCAARAARGSRNIDDRLFNGEYYMHLPDKAHATTVGSYDGCEIDQVLGQSWAWQVGLGRILPEEHVTKALQSLWRYNFTPDVAAWRAANKPGRWYAMPGEGGLIMCTWPKGDGARVQQGFDFYFNECMTGFEYQAASHMIWEGLVKEGLAVVRAIHDRYHAARRNPWNEVECGDHYARAMASHGAFLAACGFEYHGPKGHIGFAPRLTPGNFKCAFTAAEGWGSFSQVQTRGRMDISLAVNWGSLRVKTLSFVLAQPASRAAVTVAVAGSSVPATIAVNDRRALVTLAAETRIAAGQSMTIGISAGQEK